MFIEISPEFIPLFAVLVCVGIVILVAIVCFITVIIKRAKRSSKVKKDKDFEYESYFGGHDNIENVEVVMSRVNVKVKDLTKVKLDELKALGMGILVVGNVVKCASQEFADKVVNKLQ